jgi:hypothetical protein
VGIDIPARFSAYNASFAQNYFTGIFMYLTGMGALSQNPTYTRTCTNCAKCEKLCPQHIEISNELKNVARKFENLPLRVMIKFLRLFLR